MLRPPTVILAISDLGQYRNAFLAFNAYFALVSGCKDTNIIRYMAISIFYIFILYCRSGNCG